MCAHNKGFLFLTVTYIFTAKLNIVTKG